MNFVRHVGTAMILVALTLTLQSTGMAVLVDWVRARVARGGGIHRLDRVGAAVLMVRFTGLIIWLHMAEILIWASFYRWRCFAHWETAFYFSATSFSTVGYGDVVIQTEWRLLGPIESVTGVLMCGLSAGLLFAIVNRLVESVTGEGTL
jgi:voltage-gated potassium channel